MELEIKELIDTDCEFLYVLMNDNKILEALNEVTRSMSDWKDAISYWKNDSDEENYIIYDNAIPIGWIGINSILSTDKEVFIKMLVILPQKQKNGVGIYAVNNIVGKLRARKFKKISLYTDRANIKAQKCYTKCGFTIETKFCDQMSNGATIERYKMSIIL